MQRCWTRITVIIATWLKFKQRFPFGVPLQTSSFLYCVVTYTVCLLVACYATKKKIILLKATSIGLLVKYLRLVKIWFGLVCSPRTSAHRWIVPRPFARGQDKMAGHPQSSLTIKLINTHVFYILTVKIGNFSLKQVLVNWYFIIMWPLLYLHAAWLSF